MIGAAPALAGQQTHGPGACVLAVQCDHSPRNSSFLSRHKAVVHAVTSMGPKSFSPRRKDAIRQPYLIMHLSTPPQFAVWCTVCSQAAPTCRHGTRGSGFHSSCVVALTTYYAHVIHPPDMQVTLSACMHRLSSCASKEPGRACQVIRAWAMDRTTRRAVRHEPNDQAPPIGRWPGT